MLFNITFDSSVAQAPASFRTTIVAIAHFLEAQFTDSITINIAVGYGEVGGSAMSAGALGESGTYLSSFAYSQVRNALIADSRSAADISSVASLPGSDPTGGHWWVATAEAKALGLIGATAQLDGVVGFSNAVNFDYDNSNGVSLGQYDFSGVVAHEFSEVMGRIVLTGESIGSSPNGYAPLDLLHFSAPNVRSFVGPQAGYFSIDNGHTNLNNFNTNANGDFGDWAASAGHDSFLAFSSSGTTNAITTTDLTTLDVLGYNQAASTVLQGVQSPGIGWSVGITQDFNADGHDDILWINPVTGGAKITFLSGTSVLSTSDVTTPGAGCALIAHGDYNHDGNIDLFWQNTTTLQATEYFLAGGQTTSTQNVGVMPSDWQVISSADFNGDGTDDLLWQNQSTGVGLAWFMSNGIAPGWAYVGTMGTGWKVASTNDLNQDGTADILWQNTTTNEGVEWFFHNGYATSWARVGAMGAGWDVEATADLNGDGIPDLVWQNQSTSRIVEWFMNDSGVAFDWKDVGTPGIGWKVAGVIDVGHASGPTIVLQNSLVSAALEISQSSLHHSQEAPVIDSQLVEAAVATAADHAKLLAAIMPPAGELPFDFGGDPAHISDGSGSYILHF
jgi:FG-GAP-like repeat